MTGGQTKIRVDSEFRLKTMPSKPQGITAAIVILSKKLRKTYAAS
jgi:hypothetical protein